MYYYQIEKFTNLNLLCSDMNANCEVETSKNFKYIGTALREGIQHLYKLSRNKSCQCYGVTLRIFDVIDDSRSFFYGCIMFSNKGAELDFHSILLQRSTNTDFSRAEKEFILNWRSYCDSLHNQVQAIKNYASTLYSLERGGHAWELNNLWNCKKCWLEQKKQPFAPAPALKWYTWRCL